MEGIYVDIDNMTKGDLRRDLATHTEEISIGILNELKEFKTSKQSLLKKLVGSSSKKEKTKDMGLGSASS
jgi:hypothetical protein